MKSKSKQECVYDVALLDEAFLALDAGADRVRFAHGFRADAGGEGVEIARGLSRCFGFDTTLAGALAENSIGLLVKECLSRSGVNLSHLKWMRSGGGVPARNGILFYEQGFGIRGGGVLRDNSGSAAAALRPYDIDWTRLFSDQGARWFHTGSAFAAASESAGQTTLAAVRAAKRSGTLVSFRMTDASGPLPVALCRDIVREAHVLIGHPSRLAAGLGIPLPEAGASPDKTCKSITKAFANVSLIAFPLYRESSASVGDWAAAAWDGNKMLQSAGFSAVPVQSAHGVEEAFIAGFIYGLLATGDTQNALECGVAHGALCLTSTTAASLADREEVEKLMRQQGAGFQGGKAEWPLVEWSSGEW